MNKNVIFYGTAAILTGAAAYFFLMKKKQSNDLTKTLETQNSNSAIAPINTIAQPNKPGSITASVGTGFPLVYGSRGENVKKIQAFLNQKFNSGLKEDGIWGSNTNAALKKLGKTQITEADFNNYIGSPSKSGAVFNAIAKGLKMFS